MDVLLEQNRPKAGVESAKSLRLRNLREATDQAIRERRLGDQANARRLERTEGDVGEELGAGGGGQIDGGAIIGGILVAEQRDGLLLEELVATKLEGALQKIAGEGGPCAGEECACTFVGDDLAEAADHAAVVGHGVELDAGLHPATSSVLSVCVRRELGA